MFESEPEKPSQFALYWVGLVALLGGFAGAAAGALIFGEERFQSEVVLFRSFLLGALVGGLIGWRLVVPAPPKS